MSLTISSPGFSNQELEKLRLALSIFQDGTGWETIKLPKKAGGNRKYYAGYRQFERLVAELLGGVAPENKAIFDVFVPLPNTESYYGISCKMRSELNKAEKNEGRVYIEMSNASGEFSDRVKRDVGEDFLDKPNEVGDTLLKVVNNWHQMAANKIGFNVNLKESSFLVLLYNKNLKFKLFQYELELPSANQFTWGFPPSTKKREQSTRRLVGYKENSMIFEWYFLSGGQLKYYPLASEAKWTSHVFELEPLPKNVVTGITARARTYFPKKWNQINK
jgi:hypothetical protein